MQISCYYYHSNRNVAIVTFIKCHDIININIDFDVGQVFKFVITENKLKSIPNLWLCYITSLILTRDTNNLSYDDEYGPVIYIKKVWKNLYITNSYEIQEIDVSNVSNTLSSDDYIQEISHYTNDITMIRSKLLLKLIDEKLSIAEKLLLNCEMTIEKIRALNKIIPEEFPKDLYNIIYTNLIKA